MAKSSASTRILLVLLATLVLVALITLYRRQRSEGFNAALTPRMAAPEPTPAYPGSAAPFSAAGADVLPPPAGVESLSTEQYRDVPGAAASCAAGGSACASPADRLKAEDLLPKDAANSKWAQVNPAGQGDVQNRNFLTAGYHLGVDTQGATLRNASHDLRSTPAAPRIRVSIWNQSDIEPDMSRRPLE